MKKIGFILLLFIGFNLILLSPMIFLAIFSAIYEHKEANSGEIREKKAEEYLNQVSDMLEREFNVVIDRNLYKVEYVPMQGNNFYVPQTYVMGKNEGFIVYKSNYLYSNNPEMEKVLITENDASFLTSNEKDYYKELRLSLFLAILDRLGFREYVLNNLLYDESKGNNFSEIEKIFDEYKKGKIYREVGWYNQNNQYAGELKMFYGKEKDMKYDNAFSGFLVYKKANEKEGYFNSYIEHFIKYFDKKVQFEKINWYEFKKYNQLRPVIIFNFENSEKKDLEKIRDKIKKYYNQEEVIIVLTGYNREIDDPYGIW